MTIHLVGEKTKNSNSISIYWPEKVTIQRNNIFMLKEVLLLSIKRFQPFYAFCDVSTNITRKKKLTGFAVNIQAELVGMFWLTYLSEKYVSYFGADRISQLPSQQLDGISGALIELGPSPDELEISRGNAEKILGEKSFVDPLLDIDKPMGEHALTFDQL